MIMIGGLTMESEANVLKRGKTVKFVFLDGKSLIATIQEVDRYNYYVQHESGRNLIILKHSVRYIDLGGKGAN